MAVIDVGLGSEPYCLGGILWDYLRVRQEMPAYMPGSPRDVLIMVLGSPDLAIAGHAADLLKQGVSDVAVVSGGCLLPGTTTLEADAIADLIEAQGVSGDRLIRERLARNTSEHFLRTGTLLDGSSLVGGENPPKFVLLVPTPVAERRVLATGRQRWKTSQFWVSGIPETYHEYMNRMDHPIALSRMVGEIERILTYPEFGYMTAPDEPVTPRVRAAYKRLRRDFNSRPIPDYCSIPGVVPLGGTVIGGTFDRAAGL
jgi:hypothetical protein